MLRKGKHPRVCWDEKTDKTADKSKNTKRRDKSKDVSARRKTYKIKQGTQDIQKLQKKIFLINR